MHKPQPKRLKSRAKPMPFKPGPLIQPYDQLLVWLKGLDNPENKTRQLIKLPVCIQYANPDRLGIGTAHIGTSLDDLENGAILLSLDDSALGQSLFSVFQLRSQNSDYCALWLEGYWGSLLPSLFLGDGSAMPDRRSGGNGPYPFAILRIGDTICSQGTQRASSAQKPQEPITAFIY